MRIGAQRKATKAAKIPYPMARLSEFMAEGEIFIKIFMRKIMVFWPFIVYWLNCTINGG